MAVDDVGSDSRHVEEEVLEVGKGEANSELLRTRPREGLTYIHRVHSRVFEGRKLFSKH